MQFFGISGTFICWRSPPGCAPDVCTYSTNLVLFCLLSVKTIWRVHCLFTFKQSFHFAVCFHLVYTHLNSNLLFVFRRNVHSAATQRRSQVGVHRGGIHKHGVYGRGPVLRAADRGRWTLQRLPLYWAPRGEQVRAPDHQTRRRKLIEFLVS